jgi:hypothetical protein
MVSRLLGQLTAMRQRISPDWAIAGAAKVLAAAPIAAVVKNLRLFIAIPLCCFFWFGDMA